MPLKPSRPLFPLPAAPQDINPIDKVVGQNLVRLRSLNDMSQNVLAKKLSISMKQLLACEDGTSRMGAALLALSAKGFGVTPEVFFSGVYVPQKAWLCDYVHKHINSKVVLPQEMTEEQILWHIYAAIWHVPKKRTRKRKRRVRGRVNATSQQASDNN